MFIREFFEPIDEGVYDPNIFKAVFMAGSPGSGKSTIANKLFGGTGLKSLNVDNFWHLYKTKKRPGDYEKYWQHYKAQESNFLDGRLGLIIDGTAKNPEKMAQVKASLEDMGYDTAMIFVNTSLNTSLQRAINRAQSTGKDFGREINPNFIRDTWEKTQKGLGTLQSIFGNNFFIVDNDRTPNLAYVEKAMRLWLNQQPSKLAARDWIAQQLIQRRGRSSTATSDDTKQV